MKRRAEVQTETKVVNLKKQEQAIGTPPTPEPPTKVVLQPYRVVTALTTATFSILVPSATGGVLRVLEVPLGTVA